MGIARKLDAKQDLNSYLQTKAHWVRLTTFKIHQAAPETRVASSLSNVEILTALYYGGILNFDAKKTFWDGRDRFVISKGHGSIAMYPILADLGFFPLEELKTVCKEGSFLGGIPDPIVPGYETVNGSLGHGLGVACGMALALRVGKKSPQVFCMTGDGELHEGSMWEAIMFAAHHKLDNLNVIVDQNKKCMLDFTAKVIDLNPLSEKFKAFGFQVETCDGHDVVATQQALLSLKARHEGKPKVLLAQTVKGKGAPKLEASPMCHVVALTPQEIEDAIKRMEP
jgi:transketolase